MAQLERLLRTLLHSCYFAPSLVPVLGAAWCHYMENYFITCEVVLWFGPLLLWSAHLRLQLSLFCLVASN